MQPVCEIIWRETDANFVNLLIALKTYDRNALVKGVPAWRFVYHTLHSADKWFFNPFRYTERAGYEDGSDNPFAPMSRVWSDDELLDLLDLVKRKTFRYLDQLSDSALYECPPDCPFTRLELILMQFRHISVHIGMLHGLTVEKTGKFPVYVSPHSMDRLQNGYWDS